MSEWVCGWIVGTWACFHIFGGTKCPHKDFDVVVFLLGSWIKIRISFKYKHCINNYAKGSYKCVCVFR